MNRFEGKVNAQDADIDTTALAAEWPLFKSITFKNAFPIIAKWIGISAEHIRKMCKSSLRKEKATHHKL